MSRDETTSLLPLAGRLRRTRSAGCGEDFDPYNRLTSLRVLAMVADPPRPGRARPPRSPRSGTTRHRRRRGPARHHLRLELVPPPGPGDEGYPCLVTEAAARPCWAGARPCRRSISAAGPSAQLDQRREPRRAAPSLCEVVPASAPAVRLRRRLPRPGQAGRQPPPPTSITVRHATVRLRFDESQTPNQRPYLEGLAAAELVVELPEKGKVRSESTCPSAPSRWPRSPRDEETVIRALSPPESIAESYPGLDDDLKPRACASA